MLFDLRGRGRRRTIQAIYLWLAVLMAGGLVFFGIGGATNGGLLNAVGLNGGGGGGGASVFDKSLKAAERQVALTPGNAGAWYQLTKLRFEVANVPANYDQNGNFIPKARSQLAPVEQAWTQYLNLTKTPDPGLARDMVQVLGPSGLGNFPAAARAAEIVATSSPNEAIFAQMAALSYLAGETRKGDLAAAKAESLAPPSTRAALKSQLQSVRSQATASRSGGTTGASGSSSGSSSSGGGSGGGGSAGKSSGKGSSGK